LLSDVGTYVATISASFANYPLITPVTLPFLLVIFHPCNQTSFNPITIADMYFYMPQDTLPLLQSFSQLSDTVADILLSPTFCGNRTYTLTDNTGGLVNFEPALDQWNDPFILSVFANDPLRVGVYQASIQVDLNDYSLHTIYLNFFVIIIQLQNHLPYF
jgi:hypothetical protein